MVVNIVVVFIEEPHLKKKYGEKYIEYFNRTPRWLGLTKRKNRYKQN
jgi:protein-S-isoprenylcysteine O-methyltransferase Ste14